MYILIADDDEPEEPFQPEPTEDELIELYKANQRANKAVHKAVLTDTATVVAHHAHRKQNLTSVAGVLKAPAQNAVDTLSATTSA